jgi:aspartate kinase
MIAMKFGGSSVENAAAIRRVASIVKSRLERRPVVVVSAMGQTTNKLLAIAADAVHGKRDSALSQLDLLCEFHRNEAVELALDIERERLLGLIDEHFRELTEVVKGLSVLGELSPRSVDAVSSYGERLSSQIVAAAFRGAGMDAIHVDTREVVITDSRFTQAIPRFEETYARLAQRIPPLAERHVVVMGGFIASNKEGVTTTLGRGGSDYSASIVGVGIGAEEIQIWTDVDGILTCDPNIVPDAHRVRVISFAEAAELAYFGARVLHPATMMPAVEKNVSVWVLNSRRPEVEGTRIAAQAIRCRNPVKALSCKRNVTVVTIASSRMLMAYGFLRRIFEVFDRNETSVDMVSTSEVSVSLTIDETSRLEAIAAELSGFSDVKLERNQAIVCLVGDNIRYTPGVAGRAFGVLSSVNVRMISQGASLLNLSFVVADEEVQRALRLLHDEFFRELDPEVFERR